MTSTNEQAELRQRVQRLEQRCIDLERATAELRAKLSEVSVFSASGRLGDPRPSETSTPRVPEDSPGCPAGSSCYALDEPATPAPPSETISVPRELLDAPEIDLFAEVMSRYAARYAAQVCRNCPELIEQVPPSAVGYGRYRWRHAATGLFACHPGERRPRAEPRNAPAGDVPVIPGKGDES